MSFKQKIQSSVWQPAEAAIKKLVLIAPVLLLCRKNGLPQKYILFSTRLSTEAESVVKLQAYVRMINQPFKKGSVAV